MYQSLVAHKMLRIHLSADAVDASPLPHPASTLAPPGGVMSHQPGSGMVAAPLAAPSVALQGLGLAGLQALQGLHTVQASGPHWAPANTKTSDPDYKVSIVDGAACYNRSTYAPMYNKGTNYFVQFCAF